MVEKVVTIYASRDQGIYEPATTPSATSPGPRLRRPGGQQHRAWAHVWRRTDIEIEGSESFARGPDAQLYQPAPGHLEAHDDPGRGRARPRAARRGLPRPHLLGRAVRLPVPQPAVARAHPGPADVPLPAARRGPAAAPEGRARGRDVPVAERQRRPRGDPDGCISTPARGAGCPTTPTSSATSTPPSPTTSGSTTRPPATSSSSSFHGAEMMLEIARFWASIGDLRPRSTTATTSAA